MFFSGPRSSGRGLRLESSNLSRQQYQKAHRSCNTQTHWNSVDVDMLINPKGIKEKNFIGAKWSENGETLDLTGDGYGAYKEGGGHFSMQDFNRDLTKSYARNMVVEQFQLSPELTATKITCQEIANGGGEMKTAGIRRL
jgi:hypothetical protein